MADHETPHPEGTAGWMHRHVGLSSRWRLLALLAATWLIAALAALLGLPGGAPSFYVLPVTAAVGGRLASRLRDAIVLPGVAMLLPAGFVLVEGAVTGAEGAAVLADASWVALIHVVPVVLLAGAVHEAGVRLG